MFVRGWTARLTQVRKSKEEWNLQFFISLGSFFHPSIHWTCTEGLTNCPKILTLCIHELLFKFINSCKISLKIIFFRVRICFATHRLNTACYITNDIQIFFVRTFISYYCAKLITTPFPEPFHSCKLDLFYLHCRNYRRLAGVHESFKPQKNGWPCEFDVPGIRFRHQ